MAYPTNSYQHSQWRLLRAGGFAKSQNRSNVGRFGTSQGCGSRCVILSEAKNLSVIAWAANSWAAGKQGHAMKTYHVYILASASRVLYIGVTGDLLRRVREHKEKKIPGFTQRYRITELVYFEAFGDVRVAIAREKQLKGWLRARKIALIESFNPLWKDLSAELQKPIPQTEARRDSSLRSE